ncbi:MAG TPA: RHS repeat-associated core domain-containing protein [Sphingomonas sp.]|nr:RHS repeat-associated core domain-containing protein [Sphingomonas sp.]
MTFTSSDGTVIKFTPPPASGQGYLTGVGSGLGTVQSVTFSDGTKWTYYYDQYQYCTTYCETISRPSSVISNSGYQIKFNYKYNTINSQNILYSWANLQSVIALNTKIETCNTTGPCTPKNSWPTATYDITDQNIPYSTSETISVTKPDGKTFNYQNYTYYYGSEELYKISGEISPGFSIPFISYEYAANGTQLVSATQNGVKWNYTFDAGKTTVTGPNGTTRVITFDPNSLEVLSDKDESGNVTQYSYCTDNSSGCLPGKIKEITFPEGNAVSFKYDARGNITENREISKTPGTPADIVTTAGYPSSCSNATICNQPTWTRDANNNETDYGYDSTTGLPTSVTAPAPVAGGARPTTIYSYTSVGGISFPNSISTCSSAATCAGTVNEIKTTVAYNSNGLPTSVTQAAGNGSVSATTAYTYDNVGNVLTVDGPLSGTADTTTYRYDADRKLLGKISADPDESGVLVRRAQRLTYNGMDEVTEAEVGTVAGTDDSSWSAFVSKQQLVTTYDAYGRKTRDVVSAGGATYGVTDYSYDSLGRLDCTAVRMNPATWGTVTAACTAQTAGSAGPDRITRNIVYDADSRVTSVATAYGQSYASTESTTFTANGKLASITDGDGNKTTYAYDGFDRLSKTEYPNPTVGSGTSSTTDYEQLSYDANGDVTSRRLRDGQTIAYTYDHLDRLIYMDLPGNEPDVTYAYDLLGRMTSASQPGYSETFTYDALGRRLTDGQGFGTLISTWDAAGNRTKLQWPDGFYVNYDYDTLGEMTKVRENGAISGVGVLASYTYDNLGNRIGATYGNGTTSTWTPDAVSRLSSLVQNLAGTSYDLTKSFTYNPASQIASSTSSNDSYAWNAAANVNRAYTTNGLNQYTASGGVSLGYDARGNLTTSGSNAYSYSSENRMTAASGGITMYYDPFGRMTEYDTTVSTRFLYDGDETVAELNNPANAIQKRYVFGPGTDEPIVQYTGTGTTSRNWLATDERGSVIALTDASGNKVAINTYDEYGIPGTANSGRFQYTGQEWLPEVGLYYYKARMYSPSLGRFMQTDPIGYTDGLNWYNYVSGDPINMSDPTGLLHKCNDGRVLDDAAYQNSLTSGNPCVTTSSPDIVVEGSENNQTPQGDDIIVTAPRPKCDDTCWANIGELLVLFDPLTTIGRMVYGYPLGSDDMLPIPCCFTAGTLVDTPTGLKPIETLKVGDFVISRNPETGETAVKPIVAITPAHERRIWKVIISYKSQSGWREEVFETTEDHPWRTADRRWVVSSSLKPHQKLSRESGAAIVLSAADSRTTKLTYNLTIGDFHTYFVGKSKTLVHNSCWGKGTFSTVSQSLDYHFNKHSKSLGLSTVDQYKNAAINFSHNLSGARSIQQAPDTIKYIQNGQFIIIKNGLIVSYGKR